MQHYKYSVYKRFYTIPEISYIKAFFSANIKTLYTYPRSIWYSLRYNAGENFMLNNTSLYPYKYNDTEIEIKTEDPVELSNRLNSNINELSLFRYISNCATSVSEKEIKSSETKLHESANKAMSELLNTIKYGEEKVNFPAAVTARLLYSVAKNSELNIINNLKCDDNELNIMINLFIKKLEFADGDSISQVLFALASLQNFNKDTWSTLISEVKTKKFRPEFTLVSNKAPFVFRYYENDSFHTGIVDTFGNHLFFKGIFTNILHKLN